MFDDDETQEKMSEDRWSLAGIGLAAFLLVAASIALIAYDDARNRPVETSVSVERH